MARVFLDHVSKSFGRTLAVDDLVLEVDDHEFLVLVGPSGCGKTTALRMIAGLEEVSSGEVYIGERPVTRVPPKDRDIAMVFQNYALYPHMSVFDNLAFGLKLHHVPRDEVRRRVRETAAALGIETLLERTPRQLSGGQRQRVALGRAIVREPQVFLMDEPLSNLDAALRVQTRMELIKLHQRVQTTTVYVTHDQVEAMTMGHRIAVLRDGVLQQLAAPQTLYDAPANLFVAGFIGSPAMNTLPVILEQRGDDLYATALDLEVRFTTEQATALAAHGGRNVILGIRPEHVSLSAITTATTPLVATIDLIEPLGAEAYVHVHLRRGATELIARADSAAGWQVGDQVAITLAASRLHCFAPGTGVAIR